MRIPLSVKLLPRVRISLANIRRFSDYLPKPISRPEIETSLSNLPRLSDLKFDTHGRLLIYSLESKRFYVPLIVLLAFIGLSGYELFFKLLDRSVLGALISLGLITTASIAGYRNLTGMSKVIKRIYLKQDGKTILYTKIYDPKFKEVLIKSIKHNSQFSAEIKKIMDAELLEMPTERVFLANYMERRPYVYSQDLLNAIILGYDMTDVPADQRPKEEDFEYA